MIACAVIAPDGQSLRYAVAGHPPPLLIGRDGPSMLDDVLACAAVGAPDTVLGRLRDLIALTRADELILTAQIHDHAARLRSYELLAHLPGTARTE